MGCLADKWPSGGNLTTVTLKHLSIAFGLALLPFSTGCFTTPQSEAGVVDADGGDSARCMVPDDAERMADQVLQLVNLERADAGLPPVIANPDLQKMADDYACQMIDEGFFGHVDPDTGEGLSDRAAEGKYAYYAVGENLAAGQETAAEAMRVWMESPAHREIILDEKWSEVGVSVRMGGEFFIYWVQEFGAPAEE